MRFWLLLASIRRYNHAPKTSYEKANLEMFFFNLEVSYSAENNVRTSQNIIAAKAAFVWT